MPDRNRHATAKITLSYWLKLWVIEIAYKATQGNQINSLNVQHNKQMQSDTAKAAPLI